MSGLGLNGSSTGRSAAMFFSTEKISGKDQVAILVVEDDRAVQTIIDDALGEGGFDPAITASGEEALTLLSGNKIRYRALVADIGLRGRMSGWEVATRAREIHPRFPVLYISGFYAHQWLLRGVPNSVLLAKPFAPAQLVAAISQLLNAGGPATAPT